MAQRTSRFKRTVVIASVSVLGLAGAGVAVAYWTATGSGTGAATTGNTVALTIAGGATAGVLAPGGPGQTVAFTVTNPATGPQYLAGTLVSIANAGGVAWEPTGGCDQTAYHVSITTSPDGTNIAAGGHVDGVATVTMDDNGNNQDSCKGQTVPLFFEAVVGP